MQANVISFQIDHTKLLPGVYLHEVKKTNTGYVTTFDLRFKKPNKGDYLTPTQAHTIEHVLATFFTKYFKDKLYFGPMGCLTGFYLVLNNKHTAKEVIDSLALADVYFTKLLKEDKVPAKSALRCGNYKMLDIKQAYQAWNEWYLSKDKWGIKYPLIKK